MLSRRKESHLLWLLVPISWSVASCQVGRALESEDPPPEMPDAGIDSGGELGPCGQDCTKIETAPCLVAVCNTGQVVGPINQCVVVPAPKGTSCDDGKFCTVADNCDGNGVCGGGDTNRCGIKPDPCSSILCYEDLKECDVTPAGDGAACTPTNLCQVNGVCQVGQCIGEPKNCAFSPLSECNLVACDPTDGKCVGTPDITKDTRPCVLTGDPCKVNKTCLAGECIGGDPKDCSALNAGCDMGVCNPASGLCGTAPAPPGTACTPGTAECQVGSCNDKGACVASPAPDGSTCNDFNACTQGSKCVSGTCSGGMAVADCSAYLHEGFEVCPNGWKFGGDWECGKPISEGPAEAFVGNNAIATQIDGLYHVNQNYNTAVADSPVINLAGATNPMVSFWAWDHTEGGYNDGWNLKVSIDNGMSFAQVMSVTPPYNPTLIGGQPAWGGNLSAEGWRNYMADLTPYANKSIILRYAFRSDGATIYPGVYVDEIIVAEPRLIPLFITTSPALPDIYSGMAYSRTLAKLGGTTGSLWSIKAGGKNDDWLLINAATGELYGTPTPADVGPVTVTVRVEEPSLPSNFSERTFSFNVKRNTYYTSFEGMCPSGWTLTGDWQCGVPMNVGPATAFIGSQCIATRIDGLYNNLQTWAGTTATSPPIDLTNVTNPLLTFRMWIQTEGNTYDGANLKVSTDGGMSYSIVAGVSPIYTLTVAGQPAWGGQQSAAGWQFVQADLSPYVGQTIRLQFAFQSDSSGVFPGVYIDDIFIDD